jgi:hypothetical protein
MNYGIMFSEELQKQGANWWNKVKVLKDGTRVLKNPLSRQGRNQIQEAGAMANRQKHDVKALVREIKGNPYGLDASELPSYFVNKSKELARSKHGGFDSYNVANEMMGGKNGGPLLGGYLKVDGVPVSARIMGPFESNLSSEAARVLGGKIDILRLMNRPSRWPLSQNPSFVTRGTVDPYLSGSNYRVHKNLIDL